MEVTVWADNVQLLRPIATAHAPHLARTRLYACVEHDGVAGYGEVAPQPADLNGDPSVEAVVLELRATSLPQLRAMVAREGSLPSWTRVARLAGPRASSAAAMALLEMALLDREYRSRQLDVAALWPRRYDTPTQATVSLLDDDVPWTLEAGVARVRVKTAPGDPSRTARQRLEAVRVPILLDFNCSGQSVDAVLAHVATLAPLAELAAVEQPFAPGNVADHAILAQRLAVPVGLDEGVRSERDLVQIARYHAASMVCIKPARVGGLANARAMVLRAEELGLSPYLGGFFESAFARSVHRMLAESCVKEPSDLLPVALAGSESVPEVVDAHWGLGLAPNPHLLERAARLSTQG